MHEEEYSQILEKWKKKNDAEVVLMQWRVFVTDDDAKLAGKRKADSIGITGIWQLERLRGVP